MSENIFEQASREALRFDSPKGQLHVEDLWRLPLQSATGKANLNDLAIALNKKIVEGSISFVEPSTAPNKELQLKFDVVRHIINVRVAEAKIEREASDRAAQKQKILEILARKKDAALEGKSTEELEAMIKAM